MVETTGAPRQGGCFCGAVRYEIAGPVTHSMICHCRSCRRVAAAPAVAWISMPAGSLRLLAGQPASLRSSPQVLRTFCRDCGTQLTYAHLAEPGSVDVATCSLDDPEAFAPAFHAWTSERLGWLRFADGLPAHERSAHD